jgi:hypothetical protein
MLEHPAVDSMVFPKPIRLIGLITSHPPWAPLGSAAGLVLGWNLQFLFLLDALLLSSLFCF